MFCTLVIYFNLSIDICLRLSESLITIFNQYHTSNLPYFEKYFHILAKHSQKNIECYIVLFSLISNCTILFLKKMFLFSKFGRFTYLYCHTQQLEHINSKYQIDQLQMFIRYSNLTIF